MHRGIITAPTTGKNWRRAENKNNSAYFYTQITKGLIQMADETGSQNTPQGGTQPPAIDYGKIEDMIHKGTQQRESAILEGYFKQLGMSGEELQTAVQDFKTKRATQAKEKETSYQNAQQEITRLKAQVLYCIVS